MLEKGVSANWNEPMTEKQIKRLPEHQLRKIFNDIQATHNLVNVQLISAKDLEMNNDKYTYILTYSFPCQDLSLAGLGKGMDKDSNTRSSLLWEVHRILKECKQLGKMPDVLMMENVPMVHGQNNIANFREWQLELERLGYQNYWKDLIATDYGIPQIRERTFMVSVLGEYNYTFPQKQPLKLKLKDMLEEKVDEKYVLTDKMLQGMLNTTFHQYQLVNRLQDVESVIDTLTTRTGEGTPHVIPVKNATKKGYLEATEGDGININSRMKHQRGNVQKGLAQTLMHTGGESVGVVDNMKIRKLTPKECFRLMGVKDADIDKLKELTDSAKYHLAGDSIVVDVLMAIFKQML